MNSKLSLLIALLLALLSGAAILIYFDEGTLFLATLLLSILSIKFINKKFNTQSSAPTETLFLTIFSGLWFALSIAPAFGVLENEVFEFENGFFIQTVLSLTLFIFFHLTKISLIGRIEQKTKGGVGVIASTILAGAAAGITSTAIWQTYLYIINLL